jgi:hypothetical protein
MTGILESGLQSDKKLSIKMDENGLTLLLHSFRRDLISQVDISLVVDVQEGIEIRVKLSKASFIQVEHVHFLEDVDNAVTVGVDMLFHRLYTGQ